jgi:hypothetical protein
VLHPLKNPLKAASSPPARRHAGHIGSRGGLYTTAASISTPLAVNCGNAKEILGLEAGAADQRAVDLGDR